MVSRVDAKPTYWGHTLFPLMRILIEGDNRTVFRTVQSKLIGAKELKANLKDVTDLTFDIELGRYDDWAFCDSLLEDCARDTDPHSESNVLAAAIAREYPHLRAVAAAHSLSSVFTTVVSRLALESDYIAHGTEASVALVAHILAGKVYSSLDPLPHYVWARETALDIERLSGAACMINPIGLQAFAARKLPTANTTYARLRGAVTRLEAMFLRAPPVRLLKALRHHSGKRVKSFDPSDDVMDDFDLKPTKASALQVGARVLRLGNIWLVHIAPYLLVLNRDDCVSACKMLRAAANNCAFAHVSNTGIGESFLLSLAIDLFSTLLRNIHAGSHYGRTVRAIHVMMQKEFNDAYEEESDEHTHWQERSAEILAEAKKLSADGVRLWNTMARNVVTPMDRLNVGFFYHMAVGDDAELEHLREKMTTAMDRVKVPDAAVWLEFTNFVKAYLVCRFMFENRRKPACGGDLSLLDAEWARQCIAGNFRLPPVGDRGKIWLSGALAYQEFANYWHFEAQDVTLVLKDLGLYSNTLSMLDPQYANELVHTLVHGDVLDVLTGSTPQSARERIKSGAKSKATVLVASAKNENAKHSAKKRITFSADNEFRKMQSEVDKNIGRVGELIPGPAIGLNARTAEMQFRRVAAATLDTGTDPVLSHDIKGWSETQRRANFHEFQEILLQATTEAAMANIRNDWDSITAVINKEGVRVVKALPDSGFQGFPGRQDSVYHAFMLLFTVERAHRLNIMPRTVRADVFTLIDDCLAALVGGARRQQIAGIWAHLVDTYDKLGHEIDPVKSVVSLIKGVFLSRRFIHGIEVPADYKTLIKAGPSYEDSLRSGFDAVSDVFGGYLGAANAGGDAVALHAMACMDSLFELAVHNPAVATLAPQYSSVVALAPREENGWGLVDIIQWITKDVVDRRCRFNSILVQAAEWSVSPENSQRQTITHHHMRAVSAIKSQEWRAVSANAILTNPYSASREGPMTPEYIKDHMVKDLLSRMNLAEPWNALMSIERSEEHQNIRRALLNCGTLHAPTINAVWGSLPESYVTSMVGKCTRSSAVHGLLSRAEKSRVMRRIAMAFVACSSHLMFVIAGTEATISVQDLASMNAHWETAAEREAYYDRNHCSFSDHTFPDPLAVMTRVAAQNVAHASFNTATLNLRHARIAGGYDLNKASTGAGLFVPPQSDNVLERNNPAAVGWDHVSRKVAAGYAVLGWAYEQGHRVSGLVDYFVKSWNVAGDVVITDEFLGQVAGSLKRVNVSPGSRSHPIMAYRNVAQHADINLNKAFAAMPQSGHLHDNLSHIIAMRAAVVVSSAAAAAVSGGGAKWDIGLRPDYVIQVDPVRMDTDSITGMVQSAVENDALGFGFVQYSQNIAKAACIATMYDAAATLVNAYFAEEGKEFSSCLASLMALDQADLISQYSGRRVIIRSEGLMRRRVADAVREVVPNLAELLVTYEKSVAPIKGDSLAVGGKRSRLIPVLDYSGASGEVKHCVTAFRSAFLLSSKDWPDDTVMGAAAGETDSVSALRTEVVDMRMWKDILNMVRLAQGTELTADHWNRILATVGIPGFHAIKQVDAHTLSSFAGLHIQEFAKVASVNAKRIAGRKKSDYDAAPPYLVLTTNHEAYNRAARRKHMVALAKRNADDLTERLKLLEKKEPVHRGDQRYLESKLEDGAIIPAETVWAERMVYLRMRRAVFNAVRFADDLSHNEPDILKSVASAMIKSATKALERARIGAVQFPTPDTVTTHEQLTVFAASMDICLMPFDGKITWTTDPCIAAVREALDWISTDAARELATTYAMRPEDLKRKTQRSRPIAAPAPPTHAFEDLPPEDLLLEGEDEIDWEAEDPGMFVASKKQEEVWKMVLVCMYDGLVRPEALGEHLGNPQITDAATAYFADVHLVPAEELLEVYPDIKRLYNESLLTYDNDLSERFASHALNV